MADGQSSAAQSTKENTPREAITLRVKMKLMILAVLVLMSCSTVGTASSVGIAHRDSSICQGATTNWYYSYNEDQGI